MKIKNIFILIPAIALAIFTYSCTDEWVTNDDNTHGTSLKKIENTDEGQLNLLLDKAGWFPEESNVEELDNGSIRITPPAGWTYVGRDLGGAIRALIGGGTDVSCDCTSGTGCDPYVRKTDHCCNMKNGCTSCDKTVSSSGISQTDHKFTEIDVAKGGYINLSQGISFEKADETLPMAFDEMFQIPEVVSGLESFLRENELLQYAETSDNVETYSYLMNIYGRRALFNIPKEVVDSGGTTAIVNAIGDGGGSYSCSCSEGSCKLKKFMGARYCESDNCTGTCTLSSPNRIQQDFPAAAEAKAYRY